MKRPYIKSVEPKMQECQKYPRLLMLASPADFVDNLPNIGDRALQKGLISLIAEILPTAKILHDEWNAFPFETYHHILNQGIPAEKAIEKSFDNFENRAELRPAIQQTLSRFLNSSVVNHFPMMSLLDRWARGRTGQDFRQAISPRLFPRLAAWQFASKLSVSDVAIMNAGGLLSDHLAHYLPGRILSLYAAKQAGLKVAAVNYSFSIIEKEPLRRLVRQTMRAIDFHVVRESQSRDALAALGVDEKRIIVSTDAAFYSDFGPENPVVRRQRIAIFIRGDRPVDIQAWSTLVNWMRTQLNVEVIFLYGCHKNDVAVRAALGDACALGDDGNPLDNIGTMSAISTCELVISDRYHGLVFAIQAGVPFVPIASTTHKTTGLIKDLIPSLSVLPKLTVERLGQYKATISQAYESRKSLTQEVADKAAVTRTRLVKDYRHLFDQLGLLGRP